MLISNLAISCLTMSNLLWIMDLIFQIPMQYCSLQHWTLQSPPDTSTTEHHFLFGSATSFFLELLVIALRSSPGAYWTSLTADSSSSFMSFCFFILLMGFLWQEYWSGLPFPPLVDHILSELFTMTCLSWVTLHGMAHRFSELCKPLCHNKTVIHEGDHSHLLTSKSHTGVSAWWR